MSWTDRYHEIRQQSLTIAEPVPGKWINLQRGPFASPLKWHLAHTTWFFDTFLLQPATGFNPPDPAYAKLFNSYYNGVGDQHPRDARGKIDRPDLASVLEYRSLVDDSVDALLPNLTQQQKSILAIGLNHEQQHQELMLMDLKYNLFQLDQPPVYLPLARPPSRDPGPLEWLPMEEAVVACGINSDDPTFSYDNERPRHKVFLNAGAVATRLSTNGEFLEFMENGGYQRPGLWLADGWDHILKRAITAPLYWRKIDRTWHEYTLHGFTKLDLHAPVTHISYYEADAFARYNDSTLPTEMHLETLTTGRPIVGQFFNPTSLHPTASPPAKVLGDLYGSCWEWTRSPYTAYHGYQPETGALGEYNSKFMCNQMVLRGGSCVTDQSHMRPTYRNFFYPHDRWQFSGIRLFRDR